MMNDPAEPLREAPEGTLPRGPSYTRSEGNRAALERLWVQQLARAEVAEEHKRQIARKNAAAGARRYRKARAERGSL